MQPSLSGGSARALDLSLGFCSCCGSRLDLAVGLETCSSDLHLLLYVLSASAISWALPLFHPLLSLSRVGPGLPLYAWPGLALPDQVTLTALSGQHPIVAPTQLVSLFSGLGS